ncbi:hypothetical protein SAMD00023353_0900180 [Rosellinia necatrix]|uniref:Uncharacterized protein n=1 Tax=Rosellinia necatrix TaxID=77044 RepID=A0A1S8A635_ROSNE|nr:hypothetical protein SAMD00023353_0900180 [Rosellinia necatrix]
MNASVVHNIAQFVFLRRLGKLPSRACHYASAVQHIERSAGAPAGEESRTNGSVRLTSSKRIDVRKTYAVASRVGANLDPICRTPDPSSSTSPELYYEMEWTTTTAISNKQVKATVAKKNGQRKVYGSHVIAVPYSAI